MYWWDYVSMYPTESTVVILIIVGSYFGYQEISKFWNKPLYITSFGHWRVLRYIGRVSNIRNANTEESEGKLDTKLFKKDSSVEQFRAKVKMPWFNSKWLPIILERDDIVRIAPRRVVMDKRYVYWSEERGAFLLSDDRPLGYMINPDNLQRASLRKIDDIDTKSTRAARAAPQTVHQGLLQFSIPLEPGSYQEAHPEDRFKLTSKNLFDKDAMGGYEEMDEIVRRERPTPKPPQGRRDEQ